MAISYAPVAYIGPAGRPLLFNRSQSRNAPDLGTGSIPHGTNAALRYLRTVGVVQEPLPDVMDR